VIFGDSVVALLYRLLHHAVVIPIEGNSYRLRKHANLLPEHLRNRAALQSSNRWRSNAALADHDARLPGWLSGQFLLPAPTGAIGTDTRCSRRVGSWSTARSGPWGTQPRLGTRRKCNRRVASDWVEDGSRSGDDTIAPSPKLPARRQL
jgi:IstB-like ATP binding protein